MLRSSPGRSPSSSPASREGVSLVSGSVAFGRMHELGHARIDVLDLPTTGREEDAVDLSLRHRAPASTGPHRGSWPSGPGWRCLPAMCTGLDALEFADDHGFDLQRVYNIICWIHGRDPRAYPSWSRTADSRRIAGTAARGSRRLAESWRRLLRPYRPPPEAEPAPAAPREEAELERRIEDLTSRRAPCAASSPSSHRGRGRAHQLQMVAIQREPPAPCARRGG